MQDEIEKYIFAALLIQHHTYTMVHMGSVWRMSLSPPYIQAPWGKTPSQGDVKFVDEKETNDNEEDTLW